MGMKSNGGDQIVRVHGGHLVRSTGRKDRHSKVVTAKGHRDRRVRLSAHTAIQFYDVQDRLGYDRPSKAVDWLINKAKSAIDKLTLLPPSFPNPSDQEPVAGDQVKIRQEISQSSQLEKQLSTDNHLMNEYCFVPPSVNAGDAMKAFFSTAPTNNFQSLYSDEITISTPPNPTQLPSLQPFQDPSLLHSNSQGNTTHISPITDHTSQFSDSFPANFQRMVGWCTSSLPLMSGQGLTLSQRGTLQSSFTQFDHHKTPDFHRHSPIFGTRFVSDELPAFHFPFPRGGGK